MRQAEREQRTANIIKAAKSDPDLSTESLATRFNTTLEVVRRALRGANLKGAQPDGLGTILRRTHGFRAAVKKYKGEHQHG